MTTQTYLSLDLTNLLRILRGCVLASHVWDDPSVLFKILFQKQNAGHTLSITSHSLIEPSPEAVTS